MGYSGDPLSPFRGIPKGPHEIQTFWEENSLIQAKNSQAPGNYILLPDIGLRASLPRKKISPPLLKPKARQSLVLIGNPVPFPNPRKVNSPQKGPKAGNSPNFLWGSNFP